MRTGENCISLDGTPGKDKNLEGKPDHKYEDEPVQKVLSHQLCLFLWGKV
jgi:hypothetical protein